VALLMLGGGGQRGVNLVDERLLTTLADTIEALDAEDEVIGAVLAASDPKTFLAGGDVAAFLEFRDKAEVIRAIDAGNAVLRRLENWRKPLVAAVDGACLGGGTEVALAAAGIVATDARDTRFALPEVKLGLLPGLGGTVRLPRRVGLLKALDIIVSGRNVYPREALAAGLVSQVVPREALIESATALVLSLARGGRSGGAGRPLKGGAGAWRPPATASSLAQECLRLPLVLDFVLGRASTKAKVATRGNYPAAPRIVDVIGVWARRGNRAGERAAAAAFADL